jgi:hypothetical protein
VSLPENAGPEQAGRVLARAVELVRTQKLDRREALRIANAEHGNAAAQGMLFGITPEPDPPPPPPAPEPEADAGDFEDDGEAPELPLTATVEEARAYVERYSRTQAGCRCPACDRLVRTYRRLVNRTGARFLLALARESARLHAGDMTEYVDLRTPPNDDLRTPGGDYAKLRYWGLIASGENPGVWRLTGYGLAWMRDRHHIPKYAVVLDGEVIGYSDERVSFADAMRQAFDLDDAMLAPDGLSEIDGAPAALLEDDHDPE